jgi:hypothetical protein
MSVSINKEKFLNDIANKMPQIEAAMRKNVEDSFNKEILSIATPNIERLLALPSSLPTKQNKYQFYDTESDAARELKGWKKNTGDKHLIQMFEVDFSISREGKGTVIVNNDKMVRGKSGDFFLFDLLWDGTRPYVVAAEMSAERKKTVTKGTEYKSGKRKGEMRPDKVTYAQSQQDQFKKTHGKAAFKMWEDAMRVQMAKQSKVMGKRNWHISAVEQDRRRRQNLGKVEAEAVDRERAKRNEEMFRFAGGYEKGDSDYGSSESGGTKTGGQSFTQSFSYTDYKKQYKVLIREKTGLIKSMAPPKMHWYNRFNGKFYTSQIYRRGIEGDVVKDFHEYIITCVYRGIMEAMGKSSEGARAMIVQTLSRSMK